MSVFCYEIVKKITYAIEQASAARWYQEGRYTSDSTAEALEEAISALRAALIEAANAE